MSPGMQAGLVMIGCFYVAAFLLWLWAGVKLRALRRQRVAAPRVDERIFDPIRPLPFVVPVEDCPLCREVRPRSEMVQLASGPLAEFYVCRAHVFMDWPAA